MMDYRNHIREKSMLNTPPVFAVYVSLLTLRWVKEQGGIPEMEKRNKEKADMLYREIDENPLFEGTVNKEDRSRMNACFIIKKPELEKQFLQYTESLGIMGIKGHRSVGGFRASLYNGLPLESVECLVSAMRNFGAAHE
jgi:phosphoserine aminotransferase